jgi:hypothetical protein
VDFGVCIVLDAEEDADEDVDDAREAASGAEVERADEDDAEEA